MKPQTLYRLNFEQVQMKLGGKNLAPEYLKVMAFLRSLIWQCFVSLGLFNSIYTTYSSFNTEI